MLFKIYCIEINKINNYMLYNIPETSIFILFLNYYKNRNNNIDIYYVLRFLVPWLIRLNITHKNFNNKYEDVKEHKQILLPELYLFIYDFIVMKKYIRFISIT